MQKMSFRHWSMVMNDVARMRVRLLEFSCNSEMYVGQY